MIPQQQIDRIKQEANNDIIAVVKAYGPKLKTNYDGSKAKGLCPFHNEKTPSFSVSERLAMYKCFGCGEKGDAIDFVMKKKGLGFIETIRELAGFLRIIINEEKGSVPENYMPQNKLIPGIKEAKRHIRQEKLALLCFDKSDWDQLQKQGKRNAIYLPAYRPAQVELIAKYAERVVIYPKGLNRHKFFKALEITHAQPINNLQDSISIRVAKSPADEPVHWSKFIVNHFDETKSLKRSCIKILSAIPSGLTRGIEVTTFNHFWDKSKKENQ